MGKGLEPLASSRGQTNKRTNKQTGGKECAPACTENGQKGPIGAVSAMEAAAGK